MSDDLACGCDESVQLRRLVDRHGDLLERLRELGGGVALGGDGRTLLAEAGATLARIDAAREARGA